MLLINTILLSSYIFEPMLLHAWLLLKCKNLIQIIKCIAGITVSHNTFFIVAFNIIFKLSGLKL